MADKPTSQETGPLAYTPNYGNEEERLQPVEAPDDNALYRVVLPGVMQTGVDTVIATVSYTHLTLPTIYSV